MADNDGLTQTCVLQDRESRPTRKMTRVQAAALARLRTSGYSQLRCVSCEFHEGMLTLRGRVATYYMKQLAQERVRTLDGVAGINNRLEVAAPPCPP